MEHFKPYLKFASTSSNVQPPDDSADHSDPENSAENNMEPEAIEDTELNTELADILPSVSTPKKQKLERPRPKLVGRKKKQSKIMDDEKTDDSGVTKAIKYLENKNRNKNVTVDQRNMDATDLIFQGYANIIKQFTPRRQVMAKLKVAQVMSEQELEHQEVQLLSLPSQSRVEILSPNSTTSSYTPVNSPAGIF